MAMGGLGEIIGPLTEGMASAAQYQASKHERNIAWKRQQQWELMAPSLRVAGLKAAGLNPILAATQGMTGGPGHVATASPGPGPRFSSAGMVGRIQASAKQAQIMASQVEILRQQALQEQERTRQEVQRSNIAEKYSDAEAKARLAVEQEQFLNLVAQRGLTSARTSESEQTKLRLGTDRLLMEMGIPGARAMEELYQRHPFLRQIREFGGGSLIQSGVGLGTAGAIGAGSYLFGRGGRKAHPNEDFGKLVPGKKKRGKKYGR